MLKRSVDYLVVGGGFAGLNAVAAIKKVNKDASVLCVDRHAAPGGSWNDYYPFVRLHAPHPHFGVNGHKWNIGPPEMLADRQQVLHHFQSFSDTLDKQSFEFSPETDFIHLEDKVAMLENKHKGKLPVQVQKNVIDARGFNYTSHQQADMCEHSDGTTIGREVTPNDLPEVLSNRKGETLYVIIGGGKTGMDAALWLGKHKAPTDEIMLVTGRNKAFFNRDTTFPDKDKLKYSDPSLVDQFVQMATLYDGQNGSDVLSQMIEDNMQHYVGDEPPTTFSFGVLGEEEKRGVEAVARVVNDHVVSCDDSEGISRIKLAKQGDIETRKHVVLVSCRSSVAGRENVFNNTCHPLRPDGSIIFGALLGFTGPTNYLMNYMNASNPAALDSLQLYGYKQKYMKLDANWSNDFVLMVLANTLNSMSSIGPGGIGSHNLDFNQWHPWYRQGYSTAKLLANRGMILEKADSILRPLHPMDEPL